MTTHFQAKILALIVVATKIQFPENDSGHGFGCTRCFIYELSCDFSIVGFRASNFRMIFTSTPK